MTTHDSRRVFDMLVLAESRLDRLLRAARLLGSEDYDVDRDLSRLLAEARHCALLARQGDEDGAKRRLIRALLELET